MSSLFNVNKNPSILTELTRDVRAGLNQSPKDFTSLERLASFFGESTLGLNNDFPLAIKILCREEPLPPFYRAVKPFAERLIARVEPLTQASLENPTQESLSPLISELSKAHRVFHEKYLVEHERIYPCAPSTIYKNHSRTIHLYLSAFFEELSKISEEDYKICKELVIARDPQILPIFSYLAAHHLLKHSDWKIPPLFPEDLVQSLRSDYRELKEDQKRELLVCLRKGDLSSNLAKRIGALTHSLQYGEAQKPFSRVLQFVVEEATKALSLVERMDVKKSPSTLNGQIQALFLALLKQENLREPLLPINLTQGKTGILKAFEIYQKLSLEKRREFENLVLEGGEDSPDFGIYELLQLGRELFRQFLDSPEIPLHLLAKVAASHPQNAYN